LFAARIENYDWTHPSTPASQLFSEGTVVEEMSEWIRKPGETAEPEKNGRQKILLIHI
jgi:hypothetical protein